MPLKSKCHSPQKLCPYPNFLADATSARNHHCKFLHSLYSSSRRPSPAHPHFRLLSWKAWPLVDLDCDRLQGRRCFHDGSLRLSESRARHWRSACATPTHYISSGKIQKAYGDGCFEHHPYHRRPEGGEDEGCCSPLSPGKGSRSVYPAKSTRQSSVADQTFRDDVVLRAMSTRQAHLHSQEETQRTWVISQRSVGVLGAPLTQRRDNNYVFMTHIYQRMEYTYTQASYEQHVHI